MTSPLRKKRKFVGKINGHLNDFVELIKYESKICHVDLCYACLFIKDLPCRFAYAIYLLVLYLRLFLLSELSSFMNLRALWIVSNSYDEGCVDSDTRVIEFNNSQPLAPYFSSRELRDNVYMHLCKGEVQKQDSETIWSCLPRW